MKKLPFFDVYIELIRGRTLRAREKKNERDKEITRQILSIQLGQISTLKERLKRWE